MPTLVVLLAIALVSHFAYQAMAHDLVLERDQELPRLLASELGTRLEEYAGTPSNLSRAEGVYEQEIMSQATLFRRTLVEQLPAITYIASLDNPGKLLYLSPQIGQLGFAPDYWLDDPRGWLKRVHTDDQLDVIEAFAHTYEHHAPLSCEYRLIKSNGQVRWFLDEAVVVRDEGW